MKDLLLGGIIVISIVVGWGCKKEPPPPEKTTIVTEAPKTVTSEVKAHNITDAEVGLKAKCPVMGVPVTVSKKTLASEYKGKVYYFCCASCPEEFKANPGKYAAPEK